LLFIQSSPSPLHCIHHSPTSISSYFALSLLSFLTLPQQHPLRQATILTLLQQQINSASTPI
jgi:hypothetical protein